MVLSIIVCQILSPVIASSFPTSRNRSIFALNYGGRRYCRLFSKAVVPLIGEPSQKRISRTETILNDFEYTYNLYRI